VHIGHVWSWKVATFLKRRSDCEWFDRHQNCFDEVSCRSTFSNRHSAVSFRRLTTLYMTGNHKAATFTFEGSFSDKWRPCPLRYVTYRQLQWRVFHVHWMLGFTCVLIFHFRYGVSIQRAVRLETRSLHNYCSNKMH
jgi:hypothetical protein